MKHIRILALVLSLLMVFGLLCACTPAADPTPEEKEEETKSDASGEDEEPETEETFMDRIKGSSMYYWGGLIPKQDRDRTEEELAEREGQETTLSMYDELVLNRVLELEEKYDIKMVECGIDVWYMTGSEVALSVASGETKANLVHSQMDMARDWALADALVPLSEVAGEATGIDLTDTEKWGSATTQASCVVKGVQYMFPWHGSSYLPLAYFCYGQMMVNTEVLSSLEVDWTVQELDEAKQWTFDKFAEILPSVSNTDESAKVYGLGYTDMFPILAVYANGGDKLVQDASTGKYSFGLTSDNAISAIEWARTILSQSDYVLKEGEEDLSNWSFGQGKPGSGCVTFMIVNPNRVFDASTERGIFVNTTVCEFVPFPYGNDVEYGSTYTGYIMAYDSACSIFKNENNDMVLATAKVFNELCEKYAVGDYDNYQDWYFTQTWGKGQDYSFDVYYKNGHNIRWDYDVELGDTNNALNSALIGLCTTNTEASIKDTLDGFVDGINNIINEQVNP